MRYRFHWRDSREPDESYGRDVSEALFRLGFGSGAILALDYYEELSGFKYAPPEERAEFSEKAKRWFDRQPAGACCRR